MADDPGPSTSKEKPKDSTEKFDLYSEKFDPVAYLNCDRSMIPKPDAKCFDNLAMWYSFYERGGQPAKGGNKAQKSELPARRWQPHQLPVESKRPTRIQKNVFTRMETVQGPLALLRKYVEEKTRIKIITRNEKGIRGYCIAYLLAFDRHFNLVLEEVDEVWHRSIKVKKNPLFLGVSSDSESNEQQLLITSMNKVELPNIVTKKVSKNRQKCSRHVDQMLMRGEHVVLICPAPGVVREYKKD